MSNPPVARNHDPPSPIKDNPASHDDTSEVTVPTGRNPDENHHKMTLKVVKFSFVYDAKTGSSRATKYHSYSLDAGC